MDLYLTTYASIIIQVFACILGIHGLFFRVDENHQLLHDILFLETGVQIVEIFFYVFFLRTMLATSVQNMATIRYYDWFITTPTMLFSTIAYFEYLRNISKENPRKLTWKSFIKEHYKNILIIFTLNACMLFVGYLGEIKFINNYVAIVVGFIFFGALFRFIYTEYAKKSQHILLYYLMVFIWGFYGIAALLSDVNKNNTINILDLFAKNMFGIFIYYVLSQVKNN